VVLIAGGEGKGQDFSLLREPLAQKARGVVLIGRDAPLIASALQPAVLTDYALNMEAAVRQAAALAKPGDVVLLAPACASFDMFDDYAHRGECFTAAVRAMAEGRGA